MTVADYLKPGYSQKQAVTILTVNIDERYIEASLRDGGLVHILVGTAPTVFQWPKTGEVWMVWKENGYWKLAEKVQDQNSTEDWIDSLEEGDTLIKGNVKINGSLAARTYVTSIPNDSQTYNTQTFVINHNLNTKAPSVTIWEGAAVCLLGQDVTVTDTTIWISSGLAYFPTTNGLVYFPKTKELVKYAAWSFDAPSGLNKFTGCTRGYGNTIASAMSKFYNGPPVQPAEDRYYGFKPREQVFPDVVFVLDENSVLIELPLGFSNYDINSWDIRVQA